MSNKTLILAVGAGVAVGLSQVATASNTVNPFQAEVISVHSTVDETVKLAKGKCGAGSCGATEEDNEDGNDSNEVVEGNDANQ